MNQSASTVPQALKQIEQTQDLLDGLQATAEPNGLLGIAVLVAALTPFLWRFQPYFESVMDMVKRPKTKPLEPTVQSELQALRDEIAALRSAQTPFTTEAILDEIPKVLDEVVPKSKDSSIELAHQRQLEREVIRTIIGLIHHPGICVFCKEKKPSEVFPVMIAVNEHYARTYLDMPANTYVGKSDADIWNHQKAASFLLTDNYCFENPGVKHPVKEKIDDSLSGVTGFYEGYKLGHVMPSGMLVMFSMGVHVDRGSKPVFTEDQ